MNKELIQAYERILDVVHNCSPFGISTRALYERLDSKLYAWFDDALRMARDDGVIACTNGTWWRR